jgi:hypothetical protein
MTIAIDQDSKTWDRFLTKIEVWHPASCWVYTHGRNQGGYGLVSIRKPDGRPTTIAAHKYAYLALIGPVPEGIELDHLCRNPPCVNPDHLEPVTLQENMRRRWTVQKTFCKNDHPLTPDNVYRAPGPNSRRSCLTCRREHSAAHRARRSARTAS